MWHNLCHFIRSFAYLAFENEFLGRLRSFLPIKLKGCSSGPQPIINQNVSLKPSAIKISNQARSIQ